MTKHIVVIDLSVAYHQMHDTLVGCQLSPKDWLPVVKAQLVWMMSCKWLDSRFGPADQVILACDVKPYWRSEYLTRPEVLATMTDRGTKATQKKTAKLAELLTRRLPLEEMMEENRHYWEPIETDIAELAEDLKIAYKAGRKFPEQTFVKLRDQIRKLCADQGWPMLQRSGYEADDWAATVRVLNDRLPEPNNLTLVTVDSDWMGLVNERTNWFCMKGWVPRSRTYRSTEFDKWTARRLSCTVKEPFQIWDVKQRQGDKSDNLPKGSPLEVISLLEPPKEFRLWDQPRAAVEVNCLLTVGPSPVVPDVAKAVDFLRSSGIPLFIRPESGELLSTPVTLDPVKVSLTPAQHNKLKLDFSPQGVR
jgi:hypothetical protein